MAGRWRWRLDRACAPAAQAAQPRSRSPSRRRCASTLPQRPSLDRRPRRRDDARRLAGRRSTSSLGSQVEETAAARAARRGDVPPAKRRADGRRRAACEVQPPRPRRAGPPRRHRRRGRSASCSADSRRRPPGRHAPVATGSVAPLGRLRRMPVILEARRPRQALPARRGRGRGAPRRLPPGRAGRVRRDHGQRRAPASRRCSTCSAASTCRLGRGGDRRHRHLGARRGAPDAHAAREDRLRLPVLQPHPAAERRRERGAAVPHRGRPGEPPPRADGRAADAGRARRQGGARPGPAVRRRAAARGAGAGAGHEPAILLADEPTGNLDYTTGTEILDLLWDSADRLGQTIVLVTHDARAAAYADRVLVVRDGADPRRDRARPAQRPRGAAADPRASSALGL